MQSMRWAREAAFICLAMAIWLVSNSARAETLIVAEAGSDSNTARISSYTTSGTPINTNMIPGLYGFPTSIAVSDNHLFVASGKGEGFGVIGEYEFSGAPINASLLASGLIGYADSMVISDDRIFVPNYVGSWVGEYTTSGATISPKLFFIERPTGIAISGSSLIVGSTQGNITAYNTSGAFIGAIGGGRFEVLGVAALGNRIFVGTTDFFTPGGGKVIEYSASGQLVNANFITGLSYPWAIAISGDRMFVADNYSGTVGEYSTSGEVIDASLITGLHGPVGIVVTPEPSAIVLAALGGLALLGNRRRR